MIAIALFCCLQAAPTELTDERLQVLAKEAIADVERLSARRFDQAPRVRISKREEIEEILAKELVPQMRILQPDASEKDAAALAKQQAKVFGAIMVGKYSGSDDCVHVVPESAARLAEFLKAPELKSENSLRVILTHELVHAMDEHALKAFSRIADQKSVLELEIWNALLEGHAQHVTRRVFIDRKEPELFTAYERLVLAGPPGMSEGEKAVAAVMSQAMKFAYLDGRAFFDGLAESGRKSYVEDAFQKPPKDKNALLHPERFYAPAAEAGPVVDLEPAFAAFGAPFPLWAGRKVDLDESSLKTVFGDFVDAARVERALKDLVFAKVYSLTPKAAPGSKLAIVLIARHRDADAAERFLELSMALSKAKDERMKTGAIRIVKSEETPIRTKGGRDVRVMTKTVAVQGGEAIARTLIGRRDAYHLEIIYSNEDTTPEALAESADKVWEALKP